MWGSLAALSMTVIPLPSRGHHNVHGGTNGNDIQIYVGTFEAAGLGGGADKAALYRYLGSQGGKAFHMLIDGTNAAEVAPPGMATSA